MTSDERVQIYVPSPQTTPYNTITSRAGLLPPDQQQQLLHRTQQQQRSLISSGGGREDATPPPFSHRTVINSSSSDLFRAPQQQQQQPSGPSSSSTVQLNATETTTLEMVRISINSSSSVTQESRTIVEGDLPSLPDDEDEGPVSLSDVKLQEKTDS